MTKELMRLSDVVTASVGPSRTIPPQLIDIALRALRRGSTKVFIGHESLGYEFGAPIGWIMWIAPLDDGPRHHMISHHIGDDVDAHELPDWLRESAVDVDESTPLMASFIELFEAGVKNGWDMGYERRPAEHQSFLRIMKIDPAEDAMGMRHTLEAKASNWGYDEAARDRGDNVSDNVYISAHLLMEERATVFSDDGGTHREVDRAHADALIRSTAPYLRPIAYFDEAVDEWVR